MALTLTNEPDLISLGKNPTVYEFTSDNVNSTDGVLHIQDIEFTSIPSNTNELNLEWLGGDILKELVFKTSPNDTGLELKIQALATVGQYVEDVLIDELKGVYELERDFEITFQSPNKVRFTARSFGAGYELSVSTTGAYGGSSTIIQAGVDEVKRENFRVFGLIDSRYKGDSEWLRAQVDMIPIESAVTFDCSGILQAYDKMRLPASSRTLPLDISNQIIELKASFGESFGDTLVVQKLSPQDTIYAINGGYNLRDRLANSFYNDHLPDFLTSRSSVNLRSGMPYFLGYCHSGSASSLVCRGIFTYTDGTSESITIQTFSATEISLWSLPVGWDVLISKGDNAKTIKTVSVFIATSASLDTPLNNPVLLKLDRSPVLDQFILGYRNHYGLLEFFSLTGRVTKQIRIEHEKTGLWQKHDAAIENRRDTVVGLEYSLQWEVSSGLMSTAEAEAFQEVLSSDSHFLLDFGTYFPVMLQADEHTVKSSKSYSMNGYTVTIAMKKENSFSNVGDSIG